MCTVLFYLCLDLDETFKVNSFINATTTERDMSEYLWKSFKVINNDDKVINNDDNKIQYMTSYQWSTVIISLALFLRYYFFFMNQDHMWQHIFMNHHTHGGYDGRKQELIGT